MIERCPNCHARWDGNRTCRRCGMDLSALIAVEQAAERLITEAVACIAATEPDNNTSQALGRVLKRPELTRALVGGATRDLTAAVNLHGTPFARLLLGFAKQLAVGTGHPHPPRPASAEALLPGESQPAQEDQGDCGPLA
jgi:hypothetical protein